MYGKSMINGKCVQEMNSLLDLKILLTKYLYYCLFIENYPHKRHFLLVRYHTSLFVVIREKLYKSALTI